MREKTAHAALVRELCDGIVRLRFFRAQRFLPRIQKVDGSQPRRIPEIQIASFDRLKNNLQNKLIAYILYP